MGENNHGYCPELCPVFGGGVRKAMEREADIHRGGGHPKVEKETTRCFIRGIMRVHTAMTVVCTVYWQTRLSMEKYLGRGVTVGRRPGRYTSSLHLQEVKPQASSPPCLAAPR